MYKLTGRTGSIPYMAPEVMLCKKYNHKVDVYSFGILLWELFALKIPCKGFNNYDYIEKVCKRGKFSYYRCDQLLQFIEEFYMDIYSYGYIYM
jgi:serine/threonine protein kinase